MSFLTDITAVTGTGDVLDEFAPNASPFEQIGALDNLGTGPDPTQTTATLQPIAFPLVDGKGYLKLDGLTGSYASVPDAANLDGFGDFTIQVDGVSFPDWEDATNETIVSKHLPSGGGFLWRKSGGSLSFLAYYGGTHHYFFEAHGLTGSDAASLRVVRSGSSITYYIDQGAGFVSIATDVISTDTIDATSAPVEIGSWNGGLSNRTTGTVGGLKIWEDATQTSKVLDIDFTKASDADGAATITADTGQTVTMNGGARLLRGAHIEFDTVDDHFDWVAPAFSDGVLIIATKNGTYSGTIDMSGAAELSAMGFTGSHDDVDEEFVGAFVGPSTITAAQKAKVIAEFVKQGAVESFAGVTSLAWRFYQSKFKTLNLKGADNITRMNGCFRTSKLEEVPVLAINNVNTFYQAFSYCPIIDFPAGFFDDWSPASVASQCFDQTWDECSSLSATSVENILVSIDFSGIYGTNSGLVGGTALGDAVIDIDYDAGTENGVALAYAGSNYQTRGGAEVDGKIYSTSFSAYDIVRVVDISDDSISNISYSPDLGSDIYLSRPPEGDDIYYERYWGATAAPNGKVYGTPYSAGQILVIDPVAGTAVQTGAYLTGNSTLPQTGDTIDFNYDPFWNKYSGGALSSVTGNIYAMPRQGNSILKIDTATDTVTEIPLPSVLIDAAAPLSKQKSFSTVEGPDGLIYSVPWYLEYLFWINPLTDEIGYHELTTEFDGSGSGYPSSWFTYGETVGDSIYFSPGTATKVLKLTIAAGPSLMQPDLTFEYIGSDLGLNTTIKWRGIKDSGNGVLYCSPYGQDEILIIDTHDDSTQLVDTGKGGAQNWVDMTLASNGKIYANPHQATSGYLIIEPETVAARPSIVATLAAKGWTVNLTAI